MPSSSLFLTNYSLDQELISVTKENISNVCSFIYIGISVDIIILIKTFMFYVTAIIKLQSLSSTKPRSSQIPFYTSYTLSSRIALLRSKTIRWQSHPTLTSPVMMSTMFLEHSESNPVLKILTSSWNMEVPRIYFRFIGFMVKFLIIKVTVLRSSVYCQLFVG